MVHGSSSGTIWIDNLVFNPDYWQSWTYSSVAAVYSVKQSQPSAFNATINATEHTWTMIFEMILEMEDVMNEDGYHQHRQKKWIDFRSEICLYSCVIVKKFFFVIFGSCLVFLHSQFIPFLWQTVILQCFQIVRGASWHFLDPMTFEIGPIELYSVECPSTTAQTSFYYTCKGTLNMVHFLDPP